MRAILLSLFLLVTANLSAQTTAQDWTKKDCDGNDHHLFSELEAGKVVILEYIMDCSSCSNAAKNIKNIVEGYEATHPGRVKLYSIAYNNSMSCTEMQSWKTKNSLTSATVFTNGASDVSYYGGFGMPTIVVAGGNDHKVFYKTKTYSSAENTKISDAISSALQATSSVNENNADAKTGLQVQVYPNPANDVVNVNFASSVQQAVQISIADVSGKLLRNESYQYVGGNTIRINTAEMPSGFYFLNIRSAEGFSTQKICISKD